MDSNPESSKTRSDGAAAVEACVPRRAQTSAMSTRDEDFEALLAAASQYMRAGTVVDQLDHLPGKSSGH